MSREGMKPGSLRYLSLAAAITLFVLMVLGGILRVAEVGGACLDWPLCLGQVSAPMGSSLWVDVMHRALSLLACLLLLAAAVVAWKDHRRQAWISKPLFLAVLLLAAQVLVGRWMVFARPEAKTWITAGHLGLSILILGLVSLVCVISFASARSEGKQARLSYSTPFGKLSLLVLAAMFLLLTSGAAVAGNGAGQVCSTWPLCNGLGIPASGAEWLNLAHRVWVLLTGMLLAAWVWQAWHTQRSQTTALVSTTATVVLYAAQALLGSRLTGVYPMHLLVLHEATALAVWGALTVQVVSCGLSQRTREAEREEQALYRGRRQMAKDFLMLTKPIVVLLLLVTTYAGMVIAAQRLPSGWLTFWTLLGGFLAAGGSGAINQYIDRFDDLKMQRTQKRPIPAGRLTPGEGLAFGVAITLISFYIMVAFTNLLAAMLTLAGIIYYVLIYSMLLKKVTVQNIVIGGGAGAIPPLVGWAAATGNLNIPSLFLFVIIFMWTPPHFWALALVRQKDYARAGVPMLPVVRGEAETRWQIFLYTLLLVGISLLLPAFGLGKSIYLAGAAGLGMWLVSAAWKVWKQGGNKVAWKMYRYTSMYLMFLFFVLMLDRLVLIK